MLKDTELARINELAAIKKTRELTAEEASEQKVLYKKFLDDFRGRFKQQLDNIEIVDSNDPRLKNQKKH